MGGSPEADEDVLFFLNGLINADFFSAQKMTSL